MFRLLDDLTMFLDHLLDATERGAGETRLGAIDCGAELLTMLANKGWCGIEVAPRSAPQILAPS